MAELAEALPVAYTQRGTGVGPNPQWQLDTQICQEGLVP